jgi:hypothetical protein
MISSRDLDKCLKHLSVIGNRAPYDIRQRVIEIAAILSKELDVVTAIENTPDANHMLRNLDQNQLIRDNIQLYQENSKLVKENIDLKDMLESKAQSINHKIQNIHDNIIVLNQTIDKFK